MSILFKHLIKNICENKFRSMVIIFIVALSTTVSFVALSLGEVISATYAKVYNASVGEANVTIDSEAPFSANDIKLRGVDIEKSECIYDMKGKFNDGEKAIRADIRGVDAVQYVAMDSLAIIGDTVSLKKNDCIISTKSADKYGLKVGDVCRVEIDGKQYEFVVKALGESNRTFYEEQGSIQLLISIDQCNRINNQSGYITKVRLKTKTDPDKSVEILKKQNPEYEIYTGETYEKLHFQLQSVTGAMLITMCIVILIGGYIISSLVKIIMTDRIPVVGTFRSIGTDQTKIIKIELLEFFTYGIAGTLLGMIGGAAILPKVADLFNQYKEYGVHTVTKFNLVSIIIASCIGILLPPIMAISKIISVSKMDLKVIILQQQQEKQVKIGKGLLGTLIYLPFCLFTYIFNKGDSFVIGLLTIVLLIVGTTSLLQLILTGISKIWEGRVKKNGSLLLGIKSLQSNRYVRSNGSMVVTICLIFIIITTIILGIKNTAQNDLSSYGFDIICLLNGEQNIHAEDLEKYDGVTGAFESYEVMAYGNYANGYCRVYGIDDFDSLNNYMKALFYSKSGAELDKKLASVENGIVIDQYWAKVRNINIGDNIKLFYDEKKESEAGEFTVVDTWDCSKGTTDRVFVGLSLENYKKIFEIVPERILMKTSTDASKIADTIAQEYVNTNISVQPTMDFLQDQINMVNTILSILIISIIMSGLVIVIGISSNLTVAFLKRKKEYATLFSVCMDMKQLKNMIVYETIASYVAVMVTLGILYVPIVICIPKLTNGLGLIISYQANIFVILAVLIVTLIVQLATTIGPIMRLRKINIVEELKYE
jgi:ABC-type lipoprotein release transport system permease subunit